MDFNIDDPLADILSDVSADSFYDLKPKKSSNYFVNDTETSIETNKNHIENLFGIVENKTQKNFDKINDGASSLVPNILEVNSIVKSDSKVVKDTNIEAISSTAAKELSNIYSKKIKSINLDDILEEKLSTPKEKLNKEVKDKIPKSANSSQSKISIDFSTDIQQSKRNNTNKKKRAWLGLDIDRNSHEEIQSNIEKINSKNCNENIIDSPRDVLHSKTTSALKNLLEDDSLQNIAENINKLYEGQIKLEKQFNQIMEFCQLNTDNFNTFESIIEKKNFVYENKKLESEKQHLENLFENLSSSHEKETSMLGEFYRVRISFLEDSLEELNGYIVNELKRQHENFKKKIEFLEAEKSEIILRHREEINVVREENHSALERIKLRHAYNIESLKKEQSEIIVNIKEAHANELAAIKESTSYLGFLKSAADHVETASKDFIVLKNELINKMNADNNAKDTELAKRERNIEESEHRLKLLQEGSEQTQMKLIELFQSMEMKINKMVQQASDQHGMLEGKLVEMNTERKILEKDKEAFRQQINKEEKRIEEYYQHQIKDLKFIQSQLQSERSALNAEKINLSTMVKIQNSNLTEKTQEEINEAINIARDAKRQADSEREKYFKLRQDIEKKHINIFNLEDNMYKKNIELNETVRFYDIKFKELNERIKRKEENEVKFEKNRLYLQKQIKNCTEKERQLSQDRLQLSKEKLELIKLRDELKCTECGKQKFVETLRDNLIDSSVQLNDNQFDKYLDNFITKSMMNINNFTSHLNENTYAAELLISDKSDSNEKLNTM